MTTQRTHYVTTSDGVAIGGTVHGEGPALVFLQGVIGDGDLDWGRVVGHLTGRFTCHLPSLRGRGLSDDHADLSPGRIVEDVVAYVDSIGEPTGLTGWSGGGNWALVAASKSDAISAVAPFEPGILSSMDEQDQAIVGNAVARTGRLAAAGDMAAAVRAFAGFPFHDEEIALAESAGYFQNASRYVPSMLNLLQLAMASEDAAADATVLGAISAPVVVLLGADTKSAPYFSASARHVIDHVPHARVREIPGVGHAAPLTHPEALAEALAEALTECLADSPEAQLRL